MSGRFRVDMTWLHSWAGLVLGWLCFLVFLTGTLSYYRPEITRWMRPELAGPVATETAARSALDFLSRRAAEAGRWSVVLPDERSRELKVYWQPAGGGRFQSAELDPTSGAETAARASYGGDFFYRFHFQLLLPNPWGRYLAGVVALTMLVASVTGVIAHRALLADLFLLRWRGTSWRRWMDVHTGAGLLTLPTCLLLSYSGLVIFQGLYLPWSAPPRPSGSSERSVATANTAVPTAAVLAGVLRLWPGALSANRLEINNPGKPEETWTLSGGDAQGVSTRARQEVVVRARDLTVVREGESGVYDGPGRQVQGLFYGLHLARFASPGLRAGLFFLGLLATGVIASGLVVWVKKRTATPLDGRAGRRRPWLVARLNTATLVGFPLAIASYLSANRLLPVELEGRADREVAVLLWVWLGTLGWCACRPAAAGWRELSWAAGATYLALACGDALTAWPRFPQALQSGDFAYLGVEGFLLGVGVFFVLLAKRATPHPRPRPPAAPSPLPVTPDVLEVAR